MNMFNDTLPTNYEFDGRVYELRTDFRDWIKFEMILTDEDIQDKTPKLLSAVFPVIPPDKKLIDNLLWFYRCGKDPPPESSGKKSNEGKQAIPYSFEHDYWYIHSAFLELYNINLLTIPYLHWWEFKGMFMSLHDCKIVDIMGYRTEKITSKTPADRKAFLTKVKKVYALPRSQTEQQMIDKLKKLKEQYY